MPLNECGHYATHASVESCMSNPVLSSLASILGCVIPRQERNCLHGEALSEKWPDAVPWAGWTRGRPCDPPGLGVHLALSFTRHSGFKTCRGEQLLSPYTSASTGSHVVHNHRSTPPVINWGMFPSLYAHTAQHCHHEEEFLSLKSIAFKRGPEELVNITRVTQANNDIG